jgi:hypothetical protein
MRSVRARYIAVLVAAVATVGLSPGSAKAIGPRLSPGGIVVIGDEAIAELSGVGAQAAMNEVKGNQTGLIGADAVAVGPGPEFYVANCGVCASTTDSIESFGADADGNVAPDRTITGSDTGLDDPFAIALTPGGSDLWVTNTETNSVSEFASSANGNVAPLVTISGSHTDIEDPQAIAVSPDGSTLYVGSDTFSGGITVGSILRFPITASGNVAPAAVITGPQTGMQQPDGLAISADGLIHEEDGAAQAVITFAAGASGDAKPFSSLQDATNHFQVGLSLDAVGNLYATAAGGADVVRIADTSTTHPQISGTIDTSSVIDVVSSSVAAFGEAPGTTGIPTASGGNRAVSLAWAPPQFTGGGVLGYQVFANSARARPSISRSRRSTTSATHQCQR